MVVVPKIPYNVQVRFLDGETMNIKVDDVTDVHLQPVGWLFIRTDEVSYAYPVSTVKEVQIRALEVAR